MSYFSGFSVELDMLLSGDALLRIYLKMLSDRINPEIFAQQLFGRFPYNEGSKIATNKTQVESVQIGMTLKAKFSVPLLLPEGLG